MKQGLWQCGQCRQWWIYKVEPHTERLNRECLRCGKRVRATIDRRPGRRGRPATVRVEQRPSYMPHSALEHERQARNKHWRRRPAIDEFTRASKLEEWGRMVKKNEISPAAVGGSIEPFLDEEEIE